MICILKTFHFRSGCACDAMPSCSSTTSQCPRAVTLYIVAFDRFDSARNARNREIHKGPLAYAVNRLNLIPSGQCTFITGKQSSVELRQNQQRRGCVQCWYCAVRLRCWPELRRAQQFHRATRPQDLRLHMCRDHQRQGGNLMWNGCQVMAPNPYAVLGIQARERLSLAQSEASVS